jgi:hypothetical protein
VKRRKTEWNYHILRRIYILKHVFEGKIGGIEVEGGRGRRRKQILDEVKETRMYWKLQEEPLDHILRRTRFGSAKVGNE